jgi:hypothetical protein
VSWCHIVEHTYDERWKTRVQKKKERGVREAPAPYSRSRRWARAQGRQRLDGGRVGSKSLHDVQLLDRFLGI